MYDLKPNSSGPMMCLGVLVVTLALAGMVVQAGAETSERSVSLSEIFHDIEVGVGKTVLIQSQKKVSRVTVGDDKIASVKVLSPKELCITGKILGTTTMSIWGARAGCRGGLRCTRPGGHNCHQKKPAQTVSHGNQAAGHR